MRSACGLYSRILEPGRTLELPGLDVRIVGSPFSPPDHPNVFGANFKPIATSNRGSIFYAESLILETFGSWHFDYLALALIRSEWPSVTFHLFRMATAKRAKALCGMVDARPMGGAREIVAVLAPRVFPARLRLVPGIDSLARNEGL